MDNLAIARILREIADLLEIKDDNPFKIRAYRNGADIAANHPHELSLLDETGLREIPGIGKDLAARVHEIAETGDTALHRELRSRSGSASRDVTCCPMRTTRPPRSSCICGSARRTRRSSPSAACGEGATRAATWTSSPRVRRSLSWTTSSSTALSSACSDTATPGRVCWSGADSRPTCGSSPPTAGAPRCSTSPDRRPTISRCAIARSTRASS